MERNNAAMTCLHGENHATHHTAMHNIPHQSRDLKNHSGKIPFAHATHNTQQAGEQAGTPASFCLQVLLPSYTEQNPLKASTLKGNTNLKNGLPRGISPCANGKFYFLFLFGCQGLPFRKGRQAKEKKRKTQSRLSKAGFFCF